MRAPFACARHFSLYGARRRSFVFCVIINALSAAGRLKAPRLRQYNKNTENKKGLAPLEPLCDKPTVSVIMPAYNAGKYISEAVRSVKSQSCRSWELIIIDDCSGDDTADIAAAFSAADPRIKLCRNKTNVGVKRSRERALEAARGEWIAFLDADDIWEDDKLQKQLEFAARKNADLTFTASSFIDEKSIPYGWIMNVPEEIDYKGLLRQNVISCSSVLLKKYLLLYNTPSGEGTHEDYVLWLTLLKNGVHAYGLDLPLLRYRISRTSKSGNKFRSALMTYRTYRLVGLTFFDAARAMFHYALRSLRKYSNIRNLGANAGKKKRNI